MYTKVGRIYNEHSAAINQPHQLQDHLQSCLTCTPTDYPIHSIIRDDSQILSIYKNSVYA